MMAGQGEGVARLLEAQGSYSGIKIIPDLAGFDRFVIAYKKNRSLHYDSNLWFKSLLML
jgi:release factor glutamine methyltransferase